MRALLSSLLLTTALPAFADTFELDTDVTAALITGNGGVVTYSSEVALTPGRHTLITFLPNIKYAETVLETRFSDPSSVRIISQSSTQEFAKPIHHEPSEQEKAAKTALQNAIASQRTFEQEYETKQAELSATRLQLKLLQVTAETGFGTPDNGLNAEQLVAVASALADTSKQATLALANAKTELLSMEPKRKELQKNVDKAQADLNAVSPEGYSELVQVTTQIEVSKAQNATVEIDNLERASWSPTYTAELTQDGSTGKLSLHREAIVSIGEAGIKPLDVWGAVDITLSTASLSDQTDTYIPRSDIKRLIDANQLRKSKSVSATYERAEDQLAGVEEPMVLEIQEESSSNGVSFAGQTLLFSLGGKNSIDWTTETSAFNIDTLTFDLDLYAMANATRDQNAFLYTDLKNETGGVILAGPMELHRDGTLIGSTYLPQLVPNQDEPIGLGPLYGIQVKRDTLNVEEGDSGFISSKSEVNRESRTTLISSLSYDMPTKLLDVIPTSENEDLVIRMNASPRPTDENRDGKRGVLVWEFDLRAGDTETVNFGYQMKWPSGKVPVSK
jgi:uncharacterized protein (TIGR02231 family)